MALRVSGQADDVPELIDPHGGVTDLAAGVLRTPLAPEVSFTDDPLRMMRAARFIAGYGLTPVPELDGRGQGDGTPARDRVGREDPRRAGQADGGRRSVCRACGSSSTRAWRSCSCPSCRTCGVEQDPIHRHKDVLAHTIAVVAKTRPELIVRMAALLHDIGKPKTRSIGPRGVSFHHHEVVGARMARDRLRALRFPNEQIDDIATLVYLHLRFHGYHDDVWSDSAVRRYVRDAGPLLDRLNELTRCDCTTRNERKAQLLATRMDALEARIAELREREELESIRPDIDGRVVMDHLGIPPGPEVGEALAMLLEARLEEGPLDEEEALRRLDAWWAER